jgi:hypothetical protein
MAAREVCGGTLLAALGEIAESGTASGSISGRGARWAARDGVDGDALEGESAAAIRDSGEPGEPGGRMYGDSAGAGFACEAAASLAAETLRLGTNDGSRSERTWSSVMRRVASSTSAERTISA